MNGKRSLCWWMLGCTSQSMIRRRLLAVASLSRMGRSMTSLMRSSCLIQFQPRKGFQRIVGTHTRHDALRQMRRYRVVAVELPVRIIRREQEHLVGADLFDDVFDALRVGRSVERLHGDADVVADDGGRLALDPGHLDAHAAPGLVGAPHEGRQPRYAR